MTWLELARQMLDDPEDPEYTEGVVATLEMLDANRQIHTARLGENRNVMNDVEAVISGQPWSGSVDIVFSRAGSAASNLFPNMSYDEEIATTAE